MPKEAIAILENERYVQWTLKNFLGKEGYVILPFDSIPALMAAFSEHEIAALITEYWVGHFCTLDVIRSLKKRFPELYVMILTTKELNEERYREIMSGGVDDCFEKPFSSERILVHLKKGLKYRKLFLQKRELEEELSLVKRRRDLRHLLARTENAHV